MYCDDIKYRTQKIVIVLVPGERDGGAGDIVDHNVDGGELPGGGGTSIRSCVAETGMIDAEIKIDKQISGKIWIQTLNILIE